MAYTRTITVQASRREVVALLRSLPARASGHQHVGATSTQRLYVRIGLTVQDFLYRAFRQKSQGQADATGLRWPKLAPLTIRLKRRTAPANATKILREFDDLSRSLEPAARPADAQPLPPRRRLQVFELRTGSITLGTRRPYALAHHQGVPQLRLPQRRLWPEPSRWVRSWWERFLSQSRLGLMDLIETLLSHVP
jgi:hypothetical protein